MVDSLDVTYRIDLADRITAVNEGWAAFAQANAGDQLLPPAILGRSLWLSIADDTTRWVYHTLLDRVRQGGGPVRFRFRCDAPDQRRLLEMQIAAAPDGEVLFETRLLVSQRRSEVRLLEPATHRSDTLLRICGWCMRIPVASGAWLEIEEAIPALGLFEALTLPELSHGICPTCYSSLLATLDNPDIATSEKITLGALPST